MLDTLFNDDDDEESRTQLQQQKQTLKTTIREAKCKAKADPNPMIIKSAKKLKATGGLSKSRAKSNPNPTVIKSAKKLKDKYMGGISKKLSQHKGVKKPGEKKSNMKQLNVKFEQRKLIHHDKLKIGRKAERTSPLKSSLSSQKAQAIPSPTIRKVSST